MRTILEKSLCAARKYDIMDFAILKICIMCFGIIFGMTFAETFRKRINTIIILATAVFTCVYLMYKTCFVYYNKE